MMNCNDFTRHLDGYLSAELNVEAREAFLAHAGACPQCRGELEAAEELRAALSAMPVPPASPDFAERVLRQARRETAQARQNQHQRRGFIAGFGSALAAGLALWAMIGLLPPPQEQTAQAPAPEAPPQVIIAVDQTSHVNLVFQAAAAVDDAKIAIELPENISLAGYPGQRRLEWRTRLSKGNNLLRLPLIATSAGSNQQLIAHIEYGDNKTTTLRVQVIAKPNLSGQRLHNRQHGATLRT